MKFPSEMTQITEVADDDYLLIGDASDSGVSKATTVGDALASKQDVLAGTADVPGLDAALATKVDAIEGKGLSTNDYTDEDKEKLARLWGYEPGQIVSPGDNPGACMGVCPAEFLPSGMTPLAGYSNPSSDTFGNYQFSDGSILGFIPKFFYRINHSDNPTHALYAPNDIDIKGIETFSSREDAASAGYALHRAFIDGGVEQPGFFVDKYMCSKNALGTGYVASSIKNGLPLSADSGHNPISDLTACEGSRYYECITAAHARDGENGSVNTDSIFHCMTIFQASALAMLALAHSQACTRTAYCAWKDVSPYLPKGCNDNALGDYNDPSVSYVSDGYSNCGLTGSGDPFAKTTHNGQLCGIADLNGLMLEVRLGLTRPGTSSDDSTQQDDATQFYTLKESVAARLLTAGWNSGNTGSYDAWGDAGHLATLYDQITLSHISSDAFNRYGNGNNQVLSGDTSGDGYALAGMGLPKDANAKSSGGSSLFGNDYLKEYHRANLCVLSCYDWKNTSHAGVFACNLATSRASLYHGTGFRCACYPSNI
jgi:hypothetical protein